MEELQPKPVTLLTSGRKKVRNLQIVHLVLSVFLAGIGGTRTITSFFSLMTAPVANGGIIIMALVESLFSFLLLAGGVVTMIFSILNFKIKLPNRNLTYRKKFNYTFFASIPAMVTTILYFLSQAVIFLLTIIGSMDTGISPESFIIFLTTMIFSQFFSALILAAGIVVFVMAMLIKKAIMIEDFEDGKLPIAIYN